MPPARQDEHPEYPFAGPFPGLQSEVAPSQIGNAGFAEVQNLLLRRSRAEIVPEFVPLTASSPDGTPIMGFFDFFDVVGARHAGVWTMTGMFTYKNGGWTKIPPSSISGTPAPSGSPWAQGYPFSGDQTQFFQSAVVGYKLYFSQGQDTTMVWDGVTPAYFTANIFPPPSPPGYIPPFIGPVASKYLMELGFHLIVANTIEFLPDPLTGLHNAPNRVHWSQAGNGSIWASFDAGQNDLFNNLGPITGMTRLFQTGYIFQYLGIAQMIPTGIGLAPFDFITMGATAKGNVFPYALAAFGELIAAYVGRDDVYIFDGTSSQPIGQHPIDGNRRLGARTRIMADLHKAAAFYDLSVPQNNKSRVWGVIMTSANGETMEAYWLFIPELDKAWVYNFDESNWTQIIFQGGRLNGPAQSIFWVPKPGSGPLGFTPIDSLVIADNKSNNASYLDFATPSSLPTDKSLNTDDGWYIRSGPLDFDDNRHPHTVNKLRIILTDVAAGMRFFLRLKNEVKYSTPIYQITLGEGSGEPITIMVYLDNGITGKYITWEMSGSPGIPFELVEITPYPVLGGEVMTRCEVVVGGVGGITISISPGSASLGPLQTQQFTATVTGTTQTAVTWSADYGTIDSTGLYRAPGVATATTATITATLNSDPTVSVSVQVSVHPSTTISVHITPIGGNLTPGQQMQFSATVTNTSNVAVTWSADQGTIDANGLYTAPGASQVITALITATSVADPTAMATVQITVSPQPGTGAMDLVPWTQLASSATQHLTGDPNQGYEVPWLDTDAGYPPTFPKGLIWIIKNKLGNPWDILTYDQNWIAHWITENGDSVDQPACQAANGTSCWLYARAYKRHTVPAPLMPRYFTPGDTIVIDSHVTGVRTTDCEATSTATALGPIHCVTTGPFKISWGGSIDKGSGTLPNAPNYDNVNGVDTIKNEYYYTKDATQPSGYSDLEETYYVLGFGRIAWYYYKGGVFQQKTVNTVLAAGGHPAINFPCGPGKPWFVDSGGGTTPPAGLVFSNLEQKTGWIVTFGTSVGGTDPNPGHSLTQGVTQGGVHNTMALAINSAAGLWGNVQARLPVSVSGMTVPPSGVLIVDCDIYITQAANAVANLTIDTIVAQSNMLYHMGWQIDYQTSHVKIQDINGAWIDTGITAAPLPINQWNHVQMEMSINFPANLAGRLTFTVNGVQSPVPGNISPLNAKPQGWADGITMQLGVATNSAGIGYTVYYSNLQVSYPAP